jgi:hypothetical protein
MADKVTGNPYEHKLNRLQACSECSNRSPVKGCIDMSIKCERICDPEVCPACIWEVAYKAGQKSRDAELQDNANIHAGLMSVSNEAILDLHNKNVSLAERIEELEQLVEVQLKETANLGKQLDESMASYYKAEDRAEVAIGAYNTCYDRELNLKAEIDGYAKMNQSLVRDCCDLTDEVAELKQKLYASIERERQAIRQVEELKAQLKNQTEIAQKYEDRYFSSKADVANAESVAWDLQKQIEVLKANDIRTFIPDGDSCGGCVCFNDGYFCNYLQVSTCCDKPASCPKPDKGEVKP